jgi:hypothetical protein
MKKTIRFITLIAIYVSLITSCKKNSSSNSNYYVKFKLNDSLITWTNTISELGADFLDSTKTDFTINANNKDTSDAISLSVQVTGNLPTGTYQSDNSNNVIFADYFTGYNGSSDYHDYDIDDTNGMPSSTFTIILTSISAKEIKGTFTGNDLTDTYSGTTVSITNGEFFAPRIPQ